jgi:hypothetical protein
LEAAFGGRSGFDLEYTAPPKGSRGQARKFGGFLRVNRRAVLVTSPYAYQKASWLVPAKIETYNDFLD